MVYSHVAKPHTPAMMSHKLLLLLLLAPTALLMGVRADDEAPPAADEAEEVVGEESAEGGVHQDAEFAVVWPAGSPNAEPPKFQAGKQGQALIGFSNIGDNPFVVTSVTGSLRYPQDYNQVVQNFTTLSPTAAVVEANQHGSFLYSFTPSSKFDQTRELTLCITVNYQDGSEAGFSSAVFNSTVSIEEAANDVDFFTVGLYFAVLLGAGYFVMSKKSTASGAKAAKPAKKVETGTKDTIGNEWLAGTHATPKKKKN